MNNLSSFSELEKKDRVDFYIALATICCALVFILFYTFNFSSTPEEGDAFLSSSFLEAELDDPIVIDEAEYVPVVEPITSRAKEEMPAEIQSVFPAIMIDSTNYSSHKNESKTSVDNTEVVKEPQVELDANKKAETLDTATQVDSSIISTVKEKPSVVTVDKSKKEEVKDVVAKAIPANVINRDIDKSCVIAIGLYRKKSNAEKMLKRLADGGFDSFLKVRGSKFQVLVYHACNSVAINKSLKTIRSKYAADAVVLVKK